MKLELSKLSVGETKTIKAPKNIQKALTILKPLESIRTSVAHYNRRNNTKIKFSCKAPYKHITLERES